MGDAEPSEILFKFTAVEVNQSWAILSDLLRFKAI